MWDATLSMPMKFALPLQKHWKVSEKQTSKHLPLALILNDCPGINIKALVEGFLLGSYTFDAYKSKKEPCKLEKIIICLDDYSRRCFDGNGQQTLRSATTVAEATNFAKEIVNATPEDMTPIALAEVAQTLTAIPNVTCKVMDENF